MAELMDHVGVLADQIGPRPVSTEEEHQTSLYVAQELTDEGYETSVDEFATPTGVRWPYAVAFGVVTLGVIVSGLGTFIPVISTSMLIVGLILVLAGVFAYYTEYNNRPFLSKMRAGGVSQNVVAKYVPSSVARETRRRKVIIVAHVDTVRAQPEAAPQFIARTALLRKIIFYCMFGLAGATLIRVLPFPWPEAIDLVLWVISLFGCAYILVAAGCIVANRFMPFVPGGNDNASSVAVMLSVAKRLLDPEARERYERERPIAQESESFRSSVFNYDEGEGLEDDFDGEGYIDEPILHDEDEAYEMGLVPEGAEIEYDSDANRDDATVAFPSLSPEEQLDVLADTAASEIGDEDDIEAAIKSSDGESAVDLGGIPEIKVPELDVDLVDGVEIEKDEKPAEKLADDIVFADYLSREEQDAEPEPEQPERLETSEFAELDFDEESEEDAGEDEKQAPAAERDDVKPAPAPVYKPMTAPRPAAKRNRSSSSANVPSWYLAAKEKAAKDKEERAAEQEAGGEEPTVRRSRFADIPARPSDKFGRQQQTPVERFEQELAPSVAPNDEKPVEADALPEEQEKLELAPEPPVVVDLDIPDDQLDELNPDSSGIFAPVEPEVEEHPEAGEGKVTDLTSRIPNIGSSDDQKRDERKAAQAERASREIRPELQEIPAVLEDEKPASAKREGGASQKPARKRPTARHVTEQFKPTRAVDAREGKPSGGIRQEAPVSSTYEDTPQATPSFDPFAPKEERYASEEPSYQPSSRTRAGLSGKMPAVRQEGFGASSGSPSLTGSFPSLTGSFPALSGSIPTVSAEDFAESVQPVAASDAAIDDFMAAGKTTEINIPESRLHNAADKIGGLFNRRKKNGNDDSSIDGWGEDDDFGWKGGAYYDEDEAESAFDAARERAAQIRDSVVTMTESDLLDKEVWFVALGASGAGNQGMKNFLELHASELRGSLIINLEAVGAGKIHYVDMEGTGKSHRSDRRLQSLVKKGSKELKGSEMKPKSLEWRNTDATPAMMAGMRAITLMGFDENGVAPVCWHTAEDNADIVDEDNLEYVTRLILNIIENS